jgi:hypothetical protein
MNGSEANRELGRLKVLVEREAEERPIAMK